MPLTQVQPGMLGTPQPYNFKNRIMNGAMAINQRGTSFTSINSDPVYTLDRWTFACNGGGAFSASQSSDAPAGFTNSLLATVTTADGTVSSGSYYQLRQCIEGYSVADLMLGSASAQQVTVSFWLKVSVAGSYGISLRTSGGGASCVNTISATTSWAKYSITFAIDTSFTSNTTNGSGLFFTIDLGRGSSGTTASVNTWISGDYTRTSGCVQMVSTNGATLNLTGVQLEKGVTATDFDYRFYGTELAMCQRYFFTVRSTGAANGENTGMTGLSNGSTALHRTNMSLPVTMRVVPTITLSNVSGIGTDLRVYNGAAVYGVTSMGNQFSNVNYLQADFGLAGSFTTGNYLTVLWQDSITGGYIRASAEL